MNDRDKLINEAFVDELLKSGVWDIARVDRGTRADEELDEALVSERGGKKGDEGAGKDKGDKPDFTTDARKGDKSKTKKGKKDYEDDDDNGDDDNGDDKKKDFMKKFKESSSSPREIAQELMEGLDEEVILEFIDLLYATVINEEKKKDEDDEEDSGDEDDDEEE